MSVDWGNIAKTFFDAQPHPQGHGLLIGEFATAVKLASMMKFGGHAEPHEAAMFYQEFKATGMSPDEFAHTLDTIAPISYSFHGRPPTMKELVTLKDKSPAEIHRHFGDLPSKNHPEISAANFVKAYQAARPWAQQHLGREPVHTEAAYLHHSNEAAATYYQRLADQSKPPSDMLPTNGIQTQERTNPGGGGVPAIGGQALNK